MSTTLKIILKKNKGKENGEYPIYVRATKNRISRFYSTGILVKEIHWDDKERKIKKSYPNSVRANNLLLRKFMEIQAKTFEWDTNKKSIKRKNIKEELDKTSDESFTSFFDTYIAKLISDKKLGTLDKAKATYSKIHRYSKTDNIYFKDVDVVFLKGFELYMSRDLNNRINTIHANLKMIRKLFNDAIREEIISISNPFQKFQLKTEKGKREFLNEKELNRIEALNFNQDEKIFHHKNMFLFACNTGGIRVSDLLRLKWKNFDGTHVFFVQEKTKEQISIKVPNKGLNIINYYKGITGFKANNYIFPFLIDDIKEDDIFDSVSSQTAYANKNLKIIASLAEIDKPLTTHVARHTWATRALSKGIPIEIVSKILGHTSIKATLIYAKITSPLLDKAMEVFNE